jgi:DNA repair exonuclease SbcCD ATPase subunit
MSLAVTVNARALRLPLLCPFLLLVSFVFPREGNAADEQAIIEQIKKSNKAATAAYDAGDLDKMKGLVQKAITLGEKNGLGADDTMAETYVLAGVYAVDGVEKPDAGVRYFVKALKIAPDIRVPSVMATKAVMAAFKEAKSSGGGAAEEEAAPSAAAPPKSEPPPKAPREDRGALVEAERQRSASALAAERKRAEADAEKQARAAEKEAREEKEKQQKELAQIRQSEGKERAEKERLSKEKADAEQRTGEMKGKVAQLEKDKADRDKQLAEANKRIAQLEKEKADRDKQIGDAKNSMGQIAEAREKEKKEREAKEKELKDQAGKDKQERDKQVADLKGRIAQLEKEKAETEKQLGDTKERERKEKEAKEKLQQDRQQADALAKEKKARDDQERQERERLAAGPELPSRLPEALYCAIPDEAESGADLYVHCAAKPELKAKGIAFFYRSSGFAHYNSLSMERSKKGWYTTMVPAGKVTGKLLQYYVEARDGRESIAASNGKAASPNVVTLKPGAGGAAGRRGKSR